MSKNFLSQKAVLWMVLLVIYSLSLATEHLRDERKTRAIENIANDLSERMSSIEERSLVLEKNDQHLAKQLAELLR